MKNVRKRLRITLTHGSTDQRLKLYAVIKAGGTVMSDSDVVSCDNVNNMTSTVCYIDGDKPCIEVCVSNMPIAYDEINFIVHADGGGALRMNTDMTIKVEEVTDVNVGSVIFELAMRCTKPDCVYFTLLSLTKDKTGWYLRN